MSGPFSCLIQLFLSPRKMILSVSLRVGRFCDRYSKKMFTFPTQSSHQTEAHEILGVCKYNIVEMSASETLARVENNLSYQMFLWLLELKEQDR